MSDFVDFPYNEIIIRKVNEVYKETCLRLWKKGIDNRFIADSEKFSKLLWDEHFINGTIIIISHIACSILLIAESISGTPR